MSKEFNLIKNKTSKNIAPIHLLKAALEDYTLIVHKEAEVIALLLGILEQNGIDLADYEEECAAFDSLTETMITIEKDAIYEFEFVSENS